MVSELEYEIAKVAYGEVEGTIYCMQKMDASPADFDYVFFNNEHDVFRKAAGDPAEPFQFRSPADDMGVDPNRMEIGTNQQVSAPLGSRQAYGDAKRHAANTQWDYQPTQSLLDRQGGYTGPEGQKLAPRWRDRATDWMGRAKTGFGVPAYIGEKYREGMEGLDEYREGVKQRGEDRAYMEAAYDKATPEQRSQMIQSLGGDVTTIAGDGIEDAAEPVTPETGDTSGEGVPTIDQGKLAEVTSDMDAAGRAAANIGTEEEAPWTHPRGFVSPLTMDMTPFEEGGEHAGARFHGSPAFGFIPTEGEHMGQARGLGEETPSAFLSSGSSGSGHRGKRVVGPGGITDPETGKGMKGISNLSQIKPAHQMLATIATHPDHYQALQQSLAEGNPGPLMRAIEAIKEEAKDHPQMGHLADLNTGRVLSALGQGAGTGMWGDESGWLNTLFQDLGGGREDWMSAHQSHRDKPFHWREAVDESADIVPAETEAADENIAEATPPTNLVPQEVGEAVDESTAIVPAETPEKEMGGQTGGRRKGHGRPPPTRTSSDPLESAWDHLTLLKEGDE